MTTEHEVRALIAERLAAVVDDAAKRGDEAGMLRAADKLLDVLAALPVRVPGGESDDGSGRGGVHDLFQRGPTLVDGSHG